MRIQQHLSVILFVAVVGAIGLAATVGMLLVALESAALSYGTASSQQQTLMLLVTEGQVLHDATDALTVRSTGESFAVVDGAIAHSRLMLGQLDPSDLARLVDLTQAREALQRIQTLAATRSAELQHPDELEQLKAAAAGYTSALADVNSAVAELVDKKGRRLARRRRGIMLFIGAICFAYLAIIERVRQWTTRNLIDPIQKLAEAAKQAMKGGAAPTLEQGKTEELSTLANMLGSFADTIKTNVTERTAQLRKQQEILEQEVRLRRRAEQALRFSALRDKLTGLCNRDLLMDRLARCVERGERRRGYEYALLYIDLDQFGDVNDVYGQVVGDQAVIAVAERFRSALEETVEATGVEVTTLARLNSDEFAVLLDGLQDRAHAGLVAERIHELLSRPIRVQERDVSVTASIGLAFRDDCATADAVLRNAEAAMHYAKAAGKGRFNVFRRDMHDQVTHREEVGRRLRQALKHGEFTVVYQPIVSLKSGQLSGFEALARWVHPERGPVSPVEFIADAERTGVIVELGRWVLEEACMQLRRWSEELTEGQKISVSVNVSRQQLANDDLLHDVQNTLKTTGIDPTSLKLEITESVIMDNPDAVADILRQLKLLGVEIHMDDFGTGYSSLSYLHRLPIDVLKIDRSFMSTLSTDQDYADVVHTVVALARTLHMGVTVEGVEAEEQLKQLRKLECDYAQGFYFSKPVTAAEASELIRTERRWNRPAA